MKKQVENKMGLFKKKEEKRPDLSKALDNSTLPELPSLPDTNDFPSLEEFDRTSKQLPTFPKNQFGEKFSQKAIKEAVSGEEEDEGVSEFSREPLRNKVMSRELEESEFQDMPKMIQRRSYPVPQEFMSAAKKVREAEPVFIRIDKFEESLKTFEKTRQKIMEVEKMLLDIKLLKEQEEKELDSWEKELQFIKNQIERVNNDIFSKVE